MSTVRTIAALLVFLLASSSYSYADPQHVVPPGQLAATLEQQLSAEDRDRGAVREALARPEVREAAAKIGVDLSRATAAVDMLQGPDLARAGDVARQVNEQLVGGASITITTTTIIIVLLLVILLIVALK